MSCDNSVSISNMTDVWNATGNYKVAIQMDVSDISSSATSQLLNLMIDGSSRFAVNKDGCIITECLDIWLKDSSNNGFGKYLLNPSIYKNNNPIISFSETSIFPITGASYDLGQTNNIFRNIYQTTESISSPSTTEYPSDKGWGIHQDTAANKIYLAYNNTGIMETIEFGSQPISALDEGSTLISSIDGLNFVGDGVTASLSGNTVVVTVPGESGSLVQILDEGSSLTNNVSSIDFIGGGVTTTVSGDNVTVNIPIGTGGGGGSGTPLMVFDEGVPLHSDVSSIDFVGNAISATAIGSAVTVTVGDNSFTGVEVDETTITGDGLNNPLVVLEQEYTNPTGMTEDVGGLLAGTTFSNVKITNIFNDLLYPYQYPSFSSYSFFNAGPFELGQSKLAANDIHSWTTVNDSNISGSSVNLEDVTNSLVLATGMINDGFQVVLTPSSSRSTTGTNIWRISATNSLGENFSKNYEISWKHKLFYGEASSGTLDENGIESLRGNALIDDPNGIYSFTGGGYNYICYPTGFGLRSSFLDLESDINVIMEDPYIVNVTNTYGVSNDYYVYRSSNILGSGLNIQIRESGTCGTFSCIGGVSTTTSTGTGVADTNFAENDLIFNGDRVHDLQSNDLTIYNSSLSDSSRIEIFASGSNGLTITRNTQGLSNPSGSIAVDTSSIAKMRTLYTDLVGLNTLTDRNELRFFTVGNYVSLISPTGLTTNTQFILPTGDGNSGQALITDGSGQLSFADISGDTITGTNTTVSLYDDGSLLTSNLTGLNFTGSGVTISSGDGIYNVNINSSVVSSSGSGGGLSVAEYAVVVGDSSPSFDNITTTTIGSGYEVFDFGNEITRIYDSFNIVNTGDNSFTIQNDGLYRIQSNGYMLSSTSDTISIRKNGNPVVSGSHIIGSQVSAHLTYINNLVSGDKIELSTESASSDFYGTFEILKLVSSSGSSSSFNPLETHTFGVQQYSWTPMTSEAIVDLTGSSPSQTTTLTNNRTLSFAGTVPTGVDRVYYSEITSSGYSLLVSTGNDPGGFYTQPSYSPFVLAFKILSDGTPRFAGVI